MTNVTPVVLCRLHVELGITGYDVHWKESDVDDPSNGRTKRKYCYVSQITGAEIWEGKEVRKPTLYELFMWMSLISFPINDVEHTNYQPVLNEIAASNSSEVEISFC